MCKEYEATVFNSFQDELLWSDVLRKTSPFDKNSINFVMIFGAQD